jgi:hypothetical protein
MQHRGNKSILGECWYTFLPYIVIQYISFLLIREASANRLFIQTSVVTNKIEKVALTGRVDALGHPRRS